MFESAELGHAIDKTTFRAEVPALRAALLDAQFVVREQARFPVVILISGVVGSGKQWMSWISLEDQIRAMMFVLENETIRGAVNLTSPNPVTNEQFTKTLGEVLYRPTFLPLPEFAVGMIFGEMGDALLLDSTKVQPKRLEDAGFEFKYPELKFALEKAVE